MCKGLVLLRLSALVVMGLVLAGCNTGFGRSGNADLSLLSVSTGVTLTPSFDKDELEYTSRVSLSVGTVTFNATTESEKATMTLNGVSLVNDTDRTVPLVEGRNEINIVVTAENERTKTYEIVITRLNETSDNAFLDALELEHIALDSAFLSGTNSYTASTSFFVNSSRMTIRKSNELATAVLSTQTEIPLISNEVSEHFALPTGATILTVEVTAGDQVTERDYSVTITRSVKEDLVTNLSFFKASNTDIDDSFGSSIDFDGETLVVGAPSEQSELEDTEGNDNADGAGAVYVFSYTGSDWVQDDYLKASPARSIGDKFGASVSIDGNTLVVGAPGVATSAGSVYVYNLVGDEWEFDEDFPPTNVSEGDLFGSSVSIRGDYIVVGAPGTNSGDGVAYLYELSNDSWASKGTATPTATGGGFGKVVHLNADVDQAEFVVTAPNESMLTGAIYLYEISSSGDIGTATPRIADNAGDGDEFGFSVFLLGDRLVVGAPGEDGDGEGVDATDNDNLDNAGAAYVFERSGDAWDTSSQYLKARVSGDMAFGTSVALSANSVAVGAPDEDGGLDDVGDEDGTTKVDSGAVYVYQITGSTWTADVYAKSSYTGAGDGFGESISFVGESLFVAAPREDSDSDGFTNTTNDDASNSGAVYLIQ